MKILITGITGFAGSHLARYLSDLKEVKIAGLGLLPPSDKFNALFKDNLPTVYSCDLAAENLVVDILKQEMPDAVVHLAARAQVAGAWQEAASIVHTNVVCTQILMQALHKTVPDARVLLVSSGEVYGKVPREQMPISETRPLKPLNPYSASKAAQELIAMQYFHAFGAPIVVARPFNHIGPRQSGNFVVPAFAKQIAEIEAGIREPVLKVGNLESERDFTDVRDIVRAYWLLLKEGEPGVAYNIASGTSYKIQEVLDILLKLSKVKPQVETVPELMRPSDTPVVTGDASRLKSLGDWQPTVPLQQSLKDTLDYWREQVHSHAGQSKATGAAY